MRTVTALALTFLLVGCGARHHVSNIGGKDSMVKLDPAVGVYVAIPADGEYGAKVHGGSGQLVAQATAGAFSKRAKTVRVAEKQETTEDNLAAARRLGAGYVVVPTISQWEQRATEWSGRPSRMALRMAIFDASTGAQINAVSVDSRSRIMTITSTSPELLLRDSLKQYVNRLYSGNDDKED